MKKRVIWVLIVVLLLALSLGFAGCQYIGKITGGGFLYDKNNAKVTFGFNVQSEDGINAKGQFQLVDHSKKPPQIIHGTFEGKLFGLAGGKCTIKNLEGKDGTYDFTLRAEDKGEPGNSDKIWVEIYIPGPNLKYSGTIDGGNIQVHE